MFYAVSFLPFTYRFTTRLKSSMHKFSWICIYFIPVSVLYVYFIAPDIAQNSLPRALLILFVGFCIIDMIYTNGYMQNDIITTKTEINPTLRLPEALLARMRQNFTHIMLGRVGIILAMFWILYLLRYENILAFGLIMLILQGLYIIYNTRRNLINLLLIPFLSFLQFFALLLPMVYENLGILTALFALYPLPKFLEFSTQPRYKTSIITKKIIGDFDKFRVFYYGIYTLFCGGLWLYGAIEWIFFALGGYFLIFRLICLLALQKSSLTSYIQHKRYENNPHQK